MILHVVRASCVRHANKRGTDTGCRFLQSAAEEEERDSNAAARAARSVHGRQQTARAAAANGEGGEQQERANGRLANHTVDVVNKRY